MRRQTPALQLPPLYKGVAVEGRLEAFSKAVSLAALDCDPGTFVYNLNLDTAGAAMVLGPEVTLAKAMVAFCACGIGFSNALGALAPPEVAVHLEWPGDIRVNGARCGRLRVAAAEADSSSVPDWLVVGIEIAFLPRPEDRVAFNADRTALHLEGCGEVTPGNLFESWSRHTLVWLNRLQDDDIEYIHREWRGMAHGVGEEVTLTVAGKEQTGLFLGVDEQLGMLLRKGADTVLLPLTALLE